MCARAPSKRLRTSQNPQKAKFGLLHRPGPERYLMYARLCTLDTLHKTACCIGPDYA